MCKTAIYADSTPQRRIKANKRPITGCDAYCENDALDGELPTIGHKIKLYYRHSIRRCLFVRGTQGAKRRWVECERRSIRCSLKFSLGDTSEHIECGAERRRRVRAIAICMKEHIEWVHQMRIFRKSTKSTGGCGGWWEILLGAIAPNGRTAMLKRLRSNVQTANCVCVFECVCVCLWCVFNNERSAHVCLRTVFIEKCACAR